MLTECQVEHISSKKILRHYGTLLFRRRRHHMQQEEILQNDDAATRASKSHDKSMHDKREQAKQMAEELIAEERHANRPSGLSTYLITAIVGLLVWASSK